MRFIGIPNLLDTILQDATVYFVLLFACQLCLLLFVVLASVSYTFCVRGKITLTCSPCTYV